MGLLHTVEGEFEGEIKDGLEESFFSWEAAKNLPADFFLGIPPPPPSCFYYFFAMLPN